MRETKNGAIKIIPLGGVGEIGKNMTVIQYGDEIIVVDAGVMFPEEDQPGIDLVIPDITYLVENKAKVRGIILTHGHEDHIGALPYVLKQLNVPVYGTKLTLGLVKAKLTEHHLGYEPQFHTIRGGQRMSLGTFTLDFIHVNHSIPDVVAVAVHTPVGTVLLMFDFKFDQTPIDGRVTDYQKLAELGSRGVLCLLSDSTNAERPGYTLSERVVGETFMETFQRAPGRIFVATFASNVHRIQQVIEAARSYNRKVAVVGRSMENVVRIAVELGYLRIPDGMLIDVDEVDRLPAERVVVLTTGSQGEPMSALSRMAMADHRHLEIVRGDTIIISANPIPGNEKMIGRIINQLFKLGANVIYERFSGIHVSGHASQEELKMLLNLVRPRYFVPVHGEYRMLVKHASLAEAVGIPSDRIFIPEIGDVIEITPDKAAKTERVPGGQVFVDGLGVGDVGNIVLRDRRQLAQDGILIVVVGINRQNGELVAGPDIVSRGFVYVRESEHLIEEAREKVRQALLGTMKAQVEEWGVIKASVREALSRYLYEKTKRRPMILPIIMEV